MGVTTVSHWRRALGVAQFNEGTRTLFSLWKEAELPVRSVGFSPAALRRMRLRRRGLTYKHVSTRMGWTSLNTYRQMESGGRRRATPHTLNRLAAAFKCAISELLTAAGRREFQRIGGDAEASLAGLA